MNYVKEYLMTNKLNKLVFLFGKEYNEKVEKRSYEYRNNKTDK